jgi:Fe-S-cluster containining protein
VKDGVPSLRRVFLWWQRVVNGFELKATHARERTFVFTCTHFDEATRLCDSYGSRPGLCRDYPRATLTPEQRERLRRDLRLE